MRLIAALVLGLAGFTIHLAAVDALVHTYTEGSRHVSHAIR